MTSPSKQPRLAVFFSILALTALIVSGVYPALSAAVAAQPSPPEIETLSDAAILPRLVLVTDPNPAPEPRIVRAPQEIDGVERIQTANFQVNYSGSWPSAAHAAFDEALRLWGSLITSPVTIVIDASWENLGNPNMLGSAGPVSIYRNFSGRPLADTWYFSALANKLHGSDLYPGVADIDAAFNSTFQHWYFGAGTPGVGQYDFVSVVLHEIAHGLGFAGSMRVGEEGCMASGIGCWGYVGSDSVRSPVIYDRFTENGAGQALLSFPNYSTQLTAQLTGGNIVFDSAGAVAANGGNRPPLYAPGSWQLGSSYSHLANSFDDTINALMTWSLSEREVVHYPGPVALAMLNDMGWAASTQETPTPTRTPTPTVTRTPTPRFTPTPRNTPSVWGHLPSILHLSFTPTPQPFSLSGVVRFRGNPIPGIELSLQKVDAEGNRSQVATTATDANGGYRFGNPPVLAAGESYYVHYQNNAENPSYLWAWNTPRAWAGTRGAVTYAPFDIADIPLLSPDDFSSVNFPATFSWQRRSAVISDNYEFDVYDLTNYPYIYFASDPLLYVGQYTLNTLPENNVNPGGEPFVSGVPYYWEVWTYGPDGGYGVSLEYRQVTFGPARQGLEISPQELQRLVEQSRQQRMDFRR